MSQKIVHSKSLYKSFFILKLTTLKATWLPFSITSLRIFSMFLNNMFQCFNDTLSQNLFFSKAIQMVRPKLLSWPQPLTKILLSYVNWRKTLIILILIYFFGSISDGRREENQFWMSRPRFQLYRFKRLSMAVK